jgi:signal transduction histidine kinase
MRQIKAIVTQLDEARQRERQADQARILAEIATSVAHDIKAPLAAFDRLLRGVDAIPDRYRRLATLAMGRIREIAEDLTASAAAPDRHRQADRTQQIELSRLIEDVVSEASLSHSDHSGLMFSYAPTPATSLVRVEVEPQLFRRMLSNLLNNAAQAIDGPGTVAVDITSDERWVTLSIMDGGKGIPAEILPKLATRGYSIGKPGGQGLGLYHAKNSVESWGGSLAITSTLGIGTTVTVKLPTFSPRPPGSP